MKLKKGKRVIQYINDDCIFIRAGYKIINKISIISIASTLIVSMFVVTLVFAAPSKEEVVALSVDDCVVEDVEPLSKLSYSDSISPRFNFAYIYEKLHTEPIYKDLNNFDNASIIALAQTVWGEARGCSNTQKAAVVWCILNRVDNDSFPNSILQNIIAPGQFEGYDPNYPVTQDCLDIVKDVLYRWVLEKTAIGSVGRVLPPDYLFFRSNGKGENVFRKEFKSTELWDWSWGTPY